MKIVWREVSPSTNSDELVLDPEAEHGLTVAARCQTAGRGQRGNTWEAEPGKNLSFSIVLRPRHISARCQFVLSMAVAMAVADVVEQALVGTDAPAVSVKWPNDIYVGDKKIAGILIENTLTGMGIDKCIVGIGLNVNQREFLSDAPNPVSLALLAAREFSLETLLEDIVEQLVGACDSVDTDDEASAQGLSDTYNRRLWRNDGALHRWREMPSGNVIDAAISSVAVDGFLSLRFSDGSSRSYAFKEIQAML